MLININNMEHAVPINSIHRPLMMVTSLFGDYSPSGMMPFTTYPADFVTKVKMSDMSMYVAFVSAFTFRLGCAFLLTQG